LSHFFFTAPTSYDEKASKKAFKEDTKDVLTEVASIVNKIEDFSVENLQTEIKGWITRNEISFGKVMMPLRLALVGALQGPDVFDIMFMIGKDETIKRIESVINTF
jgi:glutamyl-tRNA synthetase